MIISKITAYEGSVHKIKYSAQSLFTLPLQSLFKHM